MHALFSSLHHQPALLHILLDTFMRRGIVAPDALVSYLTQNAVPVPGNMHISHVHINHSVWRMVELGMDRCLDIVKAAMSMQNNAAYTQREAALSSGGMDEGTEDAAPVDAEEEDRRDGDSRRSRSYADEASASVQVVIPEEVLEAVEAACEGSQIFYKVIVSALLEAVQSRHAALVVSGDESAGSVESGAVTSLDPCLIVNLSLLQKVLRNFHMNELGLQNSCAEGTTLPAVTARSAVAQCIANDSSCANGSSALAVLTGPARKVWRSYVMFE